MMRIEKICFIALLAVSVFTHLSCKEKQSRPNVGPSRSVNPPLQAQGFVVKTRPLSENIEVPGTLLPFETTEIRPEISGRIVELNIPEGRRINKGELLVKLFDADLQARLKKLEVQLSIAKKTVDRQQALLEINGISQQEYDLSELESNNLNADIELVKVDIGKTRIVAPYTGMIGLKNISLGAYVTPANVITTISQTNDLKLDFTVPEKYGDRMIRGRQVIFSVDGSDRKFTASIMATESTIEANTRSLKVRALVKGNQNVLIPGGFANVSLQFGKGVEPMVIPTQAVIPGARDKQVVIYRAGKPEFKVVTTGVRDSSYVEVVEGLQVGDTVVTTALLAIRPESNVVLTNVK